MMKNKSKDMKLVNWGVVTEPSWMQLIQMSATHSISHKIFGINAQIRSFGCCLGIREHLHSEEMAKIRSKSSMELITAVYAMDSRIKLSFYA